MRRSALALLVALGAARHRRRPDPPPAPTPPPAPIPPSKLSISRVGHARGRARPLHRPLVHRAGRDEAVRGQRDRGAARLSRQEEDPRQVAEVQAGQRRHRGRGDVQGRARQAPARLAIKVSHQATPGRADAARQDAARQRRRARTRAPARSGPAVRFLQAKLAAMHYVVPRTGVYDAATGRAVMAWRKVAGFSRTYVATADVFTGAARRARASSRSATPVTAATSRPGSTSRCWR